MTYANLGKTENDQNQKFRYSIKNTDLIWPKSPTKHNKYNALREYFGYCSRQWQLLTKILGGSESQYRYS